MQALLLDLDLTHRQVSNTSTTYPDAQFGWQDDKVGLGYDAALVTLTSLTYGRLFLAGFHHPRNTMSLPRLQKMVSAAEERLERRPRRRIELVEQQLRKLNKEIMRKLDLLSVQMAKRWDLGDLQEALPLAVTQLEAEVTSLGTTYKEQNRKEKPYSKLAKARRQLAAAQRRLAKVPERLQKTERVIATHQARLDQLQAKRAELKEHLERLRNDNENNHEPVTIVLRLDAGFGTGPNLAWLIEMGYIIYTKAFNAQVAARLRDKVNPGDRWTRVGKNADMIAWDEQYINGCPYPLTMALERFHTPKEEKHSALIVYRDDEQQFILPAWFNFYNGRQTIEAGIKETNVVFKMHPLKMRSQGGIVIQEQFTLFAANFVRFARVWLRERVSCSSRKFDDALTRVKDLVRVGANTSAWVVGQRADLLVKFDHTGAYPGVELQLAGSWRTRPPIRPHRKVRKFDFRNDFVSGCT
jgi:TolA-binding protein